MDFDKPKVYGDTSIADGLVVVVVVAMFSSQFASHRSSDTRKALACEICGRGA